MVDATYHTTAAWRGSGELRAHDIYATKSCEKILILCLIYRGILTSIGAIATAVYGLHTIRILPTVLILS